MEEFKTINRFLENYFVGPWAYRPFAKSDTFPLFQATRHPDFNQHLLWSAPDTVADLQTQVQLLVREHNLGRSSAFSICEKDTGRWAGFIKYAPYRDSISMSFWIHPDFWKSSLGYRTTRFGLDVALEQAKVPHLYAYVAMQNTPMQNMCEKSGYEYEGIVKLPHNDGHEVDMKLYKLTRETWSTFDHKAVSEIY